MGAYADAGEYYLSQIKPPVHGQKKMEGNSLYVFNATPWGGTWQYAGKYHSARESILMSLRYAGWTEQQVDEVLKIIREEQP